MSRSSRTRRGSTRRTQRDLCRLRSRRRRLRQFRHALRRLGRLLPRAQAAGDGGARPFDGSLTTIRAARDRRRTAQPNPTYRCLFPDPPPPGTVPACAEAGVLGALAGVMGSLMALEVIREIVGFGEGLVGRLLMVDARAMRFETLRYGWDPDNPLNGRGASPRGGAKFLENSP